MTAKKKKKENTNIVTGFDADLGRHVKVALFDGEGVALNILSGTPEALEPYLAQYQHIFLADTKYADVEMASDLPDYKTVAKK